MATLTPTNPSTGAAAAESFDLVELVQQSYGRCCVAGTFFDDFYTAFTASSPAIRAKFAKTDFVKQKKLLRQSITFMIMYYRGSAMANDVVREIGKTHARTQLDIHPNLYSYWLDTLISTIRKTDAQFTPELEQAWRKVLERGITAIKAAY